MAQNNDDMFEDDDQESGGASSKPRRQKAAGGGTNWGKVILILLGVGGISLALCCGVGYYFLSGAVTDDPVRIAAMQKEIVEIDVPPAMQPVGGVNMNLGFMKMRMVMYGPQKGSAEMLMLMQMQISGQTEGQMQQAFNQQAGQQQNAQFKLESSETKTIKVDGQDRNFIFAKGTISPPGGTATPRAHGDRHVPLQRWDGVYSVFDR